MSFSSSAFFLVHGVTVLLLLLLLILHPFNGLFPGQLG